MGWGPLGVFSQRTFDFLYERIHCGQRSYHNNVAFAKFQPIFRDSNVKISPEDHAPGPTSSLWSLNSVPLLSSSTWYPPTFLFLSLEFLLLQLPTQIFPHFSWKNCRSWGNYNRLQKCWDTAKFRHLHHHRSNVRTVLQPIVAGVCYSDTHLSLERAETLTGCTLFPFRGSQDSRRSNQGWFQNRLWH